jgi:hypothetical protein
MEDIKMKKKPFQRRIRIRHEALIEYEGDCNNEKNQPKLEAVVVSRFEDLNDKYNDDRRETREKYNYHLQLRYTFNIEENILERIEIEGPLHKDGMLYFSKENVRCLYERKR